MVEVIMHEMSADEQTREIARLREKAILDERSALNFAKSEGRAEGRKERDAELIARMRALGHTEEEIRELFGDEN